MKTKTRDFYDGEGVLLDLGVADVHEPGEGSEPDDEPKRIAICKKGVVRRTPLGPVQDRRRDPGSDRREPQSDDEPAHPMGFRACLGDAAGK